MHPTIGLFIARARIADLHEEARRVRLARPVGRWLY
jgi:hypothetical protein